MDPQRRRRLLLVLAIAGVSIVVVTVVLNVPIAQEASGYQLVGLRLFSFESQSLFGNSWTNYTYRGVTFSFHLWCSAGPAAGEVCGNATESDGGSYAYSFEDGITVRGWQTWVSPDSHEAVQYQQGGLVHLLVAV